MSNSNDPKADLEREFRHEMRNSIAVLFAKLDKVIEGMAEKQDVEKLNTRLTLLEQERSRLVGAGIVLQAIGGVILWVIFKATK